MSVKINGRRFDFDSDELYPGMKPKADRMTLYAWGIIGAGFLLALLWWKFAGGLGLAGFLKLFPFFRGYL